MTGLIVEFIEKKLENSLLQPFCEETFEASHLIFNQKNTYFYLICSNTRHMMYQKAEKYSKSFNS